MKETLMTVTEYCKHADLSRKRFYEYKNDGILDGCFKQKPGRKKDFVMVEAADRAIEKNVSAVHKIGGDALKTKLKNKKLSKADRAEVKELSGLSLNELRRQREAEKLMIDRITRRTLEHELIDASLVAKEAYESALQVRETLEALPARLAPLLAAESDPWQCGEILAKEINFTLHKLADEIRAGAKND